MPRERPILEFENKRFERRKGTWFDGASQIRVALTTARLLDGEAQADRAFWHRCNQQDLDDNPKKRGGILLAPEDFGLSEWPGQEARPKQGFQSQVRSRRSSSVDYAWKRGRQTLELTADIEQGWRPTKRSWCFRGSTLTPLRRGHSLRLTVEIVEDTWHSARLHSRVFPSRCRELGSGDELDAMYPVFPLAEREAAAMRLRLEGVKLVTSLTVFDSDDDLNAKLPWECKGARWAFKYSESGFVESYIADRAHHVCIARPFAVRLSGALHGPPREPLAPTLEYDTPLPSAGLPSLGKR